MRRPALLLVLVVAVAGCSADLGPNVHVIREAQLWMGARDTPPPDDAPGGELVRLPDGWGVRRRLHATQGWYRAWVTLDGRPSEPWVVYLPRAAVTAGVWVNGEPIGDGGGFAEPLPRNGNRPLLFSLPPALLRAGANRIDVRLAMGASAPGLLEPIEVGPAHRLAPRHAVRTLLQRTLVQVLTLAALGLGALVGGFFRRRDQLYAYHWMVAGVLCWALASIDVFVVRSPLPSRFWDFFGIAGQSAFVVCCILGFHRLLGRRPVRLERALAAGLLAFAIVHVLVPAPWAFTVAIFWGLATIGAGVYLIVLIVRLGKTGAGAGAGVMPLAPAGVIAIALGLHDIVSVFAGRILLGVVLSPYIPAFFLVVSFWNVLSYLADALTESETLNRELEQRVADKAAALARQHERLRELERARAVATERERIMRDVHDGMGAQLVSTLAMVEGGRCAPDTVADALRSALDDLRLVIDSLEPVEEDLLAVLATVRARLEPRLVRHGLRFDWQVHDLPPLRGFGPERALQALRIVQEAMTNVLKHARATTIAVRTGQAPDDGGAPGVFVEIADDGTGLDPQRPAGRGLANMARRARALGGHVTVASAGRGTVVRLWLPQPETPAAA